MFQRHMKTKGRKNPKDNLLQSNLSLSKRKHIDNYSRKHKQYIK